MMAFKEFLYKGYREVTLEKLVRDLGLTKGAFYHYFTSKQQLFEEVVNEFVFSRTMSLEGYTYDETKTMIDNILYVLSCELEEYLKIRAEFSEDMNDNADVNYYGLMIDAAKYYPNFFSIVSEKHKAKEIQLYLNYIEHARNKGEIKISIDPVMLANTIQALLDGVGINYFFNQEEKDIKLHVSKSLRFLYELIKS